MRFSRMTIRHIMHGVGVAFIWCLLFGLNAQAQFVEQQKLTASDGTSGDFFGATVSLSGNYLVVGAPFENASQGAASGVGTHFLGRGEWLRG
ncbi:FG-GAP repeat protein [Candidatus Entotheonella palauensis]|uniref:FG-GAP repeat protein n=1 Tax=Candidatus Entotheonella palauensis TaxID=93172 RepID=UPI000B7EFCC5|nr:FG-GAP repeat protein [Candidatus Entotheonella palauensis]